MSNDLINKFVLGVKLCRPMHVIKNFLILMPAFFSRSLLNFNVLLSAIPAILSFSLIASVVYVINDICDLKKDRRHPVKCMRPIASGKFPVGAAIFLVFLLLFSGCAIVYFYRCKWQIFALLLSYLALNLAYSFRLKHVPLLDIFILASGFVMRVYYGGLWFDIPISSWLFLCIFSGSLCLATGKRRNELIYAKEKRAMTRPVLRKYTKGYLTNCYYLFCGVTIVFFSLWALMVIQQTIMQFTIPVMTMLFLRYNLIIETTQSDGDPVSVLMKDKLLIFWGIVFVVMSAIGLYWP